MLEERKRMLKLFAVIIYPIMAVVVVRFSNFKGKSLMKLIDYMDKEMRERPYHFEVSITTIKILMVFTLIYVMIFFLIITSLKNTMPGIEHDSAHWENAKKISKKLQAKKGDEELEKQYKNILFSQNLRVSIDERGANINTLVMGEPGTQKTRGFIIPNILQLNCNMVITDPKGEILKKTGNYLVSNGYDVRVLDLSDLVKSHGYNPFRYFRNDEDIFLFVNNMWASMDDKTAAKGEQIWSDLAKCMLMSFCLYLHHFAPKEEQNMTSVMKIFACIDDSENKKNDDPVDKLFKRIKRLGETSYGYYEMWNSAKGRTLASIRATFASRMAAFNLDTMKSLSYKDEMEILDLATKKVAIFMILSDSTSVYNFMAGTLYTQIFQQLYDYADHIADGPLPRHVRFFLDEFGNIALPDDYHRILSTSRSRNISFIMVLQNKQQIEAIFEKYYKTLYGDCAWYVFLGSHELETCKYYSELLGKYTVHAYTYSKNYGRQGGTTKQEQLIERDLMTPREVARLSKRKCIVYTDDKGAVLDRKYNLKRHTKYRFIADHKKDKVYDWGSSPLAVGSVNVVDNHYSGRLTALPEADGYLLDVDEYEN